LTEEDYYLSIPLQRGQLSCRELLNDLTLARDCRKDEAIMVDMTESPYSRDPGLKRQIYERGL